MWRASTAAVWLRGLRRSRRQIDGDPVVVHLEHPRADAGLQLDAHIAATVGTGCAGTLEPGAKARSEHGRVDDAGATEPNVDAPCCGHRLESGRQRPLEHGATEAVMQTRAHLDLLSGGDRRQVGHDDAPLWDGVAHGAVRRQVEHHDAPVLDRLTHGDARRQLERQLAPVMPEMRAPEVCAKTRHDGIERDRERPPEAEPIETAFLQAFDLDRRGPLEHQAAKARVDPGAHRHLLEAACRGRYDDREQRDERAHQSAVPARSARRVPEIVEPNASQMAHEAGRQRTEAVQCAPLPVRAGPDQPPITRAMRSLRASALNGLTM